MNAVETFRPAYYNGERLKNYLVSDLGNVISLFNGNPRFLKKSKMTGYYNYELYVDKIKKPFSRRRLVAHTFPDRVKGKYFIKRHIHHLNNIKTDDRPENFEFVTATGNARRMFKDGLHPFNYTTNKKLKEALEYAYENIHREDLQDIARKFGINRSAFSSCANDKRRHRDLRAVCRKLGITPEQFIWRISKNERAYNILNLYNNGKQVKDIASLYGMNSASICNILDGDNKSHVLEKYCNDNNISLEEWRNIRNTRKRYDHQRF